MQIKGYREQPEINIALVNAIKETEEKILKALDGLETIPEFDKRWLNIGRTHIEEAFMSINRAILQPQRIK